MKTTPKEATELVGKVEIEGTPFTAIRENEKWFITLGRYRLTPEMDSYDDCAVMAEQAPWPLIMAVMKAMITHEKIETQVLKGQ